MFTPVINERVKVLVFYIVQSGFRYVVVKQM